MDGAGTLLCLPLCRASVQVIAWEFRPHGRGFCKVVESKQDTKSRTLRPPPRFLGFQ